MKFLLLLASFFVLDCNLGASSWTCVVQGLQMCGPVAMTISETVSVPYGTGPGQDDSASASTGLGADTSTGDATAGEGAGPACSDVSATTGEARR
jgi:hypothetical protein